MARRGVFQIPRRPFYIAWQQGRLYAVGMSNVVAIQGQSASFHDTASRQFFGDAIRLVCCDLPFSTVFDALEQPTTDYAVCAIENSLYGAINDVYDLLVARRPWICGEVRLRIEQCLIGLPQSSIGKIAAVHSHPVALAQCEAFLKEHLPQATRLEADDTAGSVAMIAEIGDPTKAAIASAEAAAAYGMKVLQRSIETNHQNFTRFAVLSRQPSSYEHATKTSAVIELPHEPGALHAALGAFAKERINITLLVSRPVVGKPGEYRFYIDFASGLQEARTARALHALERIATTIIILGSYRAAD